MKLARSFGWTPRVLVLLTLALLWFPVGNGFAQGKADGDKPAAAKKADADKADADNGDRKSTRLNSSHW